MLPGPFQTRTADALTTKMTITSTGNVGIGTNSPNRELTVNGQIQANDIVLSSAAYLGGTAAANALDDYEEGTFTPTFVGATITGGNIRGSYTKIGRQVYITVQFVNATISGSAGNASVQSLPFTCNSLYYGVASISYGNALSPTSTSGWIDVSSTTIVLMDGTGISNANFVDGTNNRSMMLNAVYQV